MPMTIVRYLAITVMFLVAAGCGRSTEKNESKPAAKQTKQRWKFKDHNIVLVSFDALQAAHVSHLGYKRKTTPALDAFAKNSFTFTKAYSVASWTVPASMTWFTGVYPSEHGLTNRFLIFNAKVKKLAKLDELSPHLVTLAQVMKKNGYATGGFTGNAGVSGFLGYERGFDIYYYPKGEFGRLDGSVPRALAWLKKNKEKKFFLFLHGYDVHGQSSPKDGFDYRFVDKDYDKKYTGSEQEQELLREEGLDKGMLTMRAEDIEFWRAIYDEKINRADAEFKHFLTEFDKLGLVEKTLFVLTSDHGTEFYEHRRFDHGFSLYDELIHVPLIIKLPKQTKGKVVSDLVSSIDVMPTILDLVDAKISDKVKKQLRGKSLVAACKGKHVQRPVYSETNYRAYTYKRAIIMPDGWKLIYTLEDKTRELYDLKNDPGETKNLAAAKPKMANDLQKRLFDHYESIGHDLTKPKWERGLLPVYPSQEKLLKKK